MNIHEVISKNFPTNGSLVIFLLYMGMFVAQVRNQLFTTIKPYFYGKTQGMLVTASRYGGSDYSYNTVTVVLITETLKLLLSSSVYLKDKTAASLGDSIIKNKKVLGLYFVPAALYCLYNNLSFVR